MKSRILIEEVIREPVASNAVSICSLPPHNILLP